MMLKEKPREPYEMNSNDNLEEMVFPPFKLESLRKFPWKMIEKQDLTSESSLEEIRFVGLEPEIQFDFLSKMQKNEDLFTRWILTSNPSLRSFRANGKNGYLYIKGKDSTRLALVLNITIPANQKFDLDIECFHTGSAKTISQLLLVIHLEEGALLNLFFGGEAGEEVVYFDAIHTFQSANSCLDFRHLKLGGWKGKTFVYPVLEGRDSSFDFYSLGALKKLEFQELEALVTHKAPSTKSHIESRVVVKDRSHSIFTGNLRIPPKTQKVSAHQISRGLALDPKARAEAIPKLEVKAEDVSCTHGATVGDVDPEELFYLESRGLSKEEAKILLVEAFLGELLDFPSLDENLKNRWKDKLLMRLN